ncbi:MarR family winged helix-turn-helix transcriptional regulator [Ancylomarina sp. 16SWW S1-10-2]|uniref:MarR family winged helix-turn-helix transcriptional regulator n=1 Tax=Ancylomarina sp. 16SWW S1-10-2 TaxID=2499681 RepID=UPI0012AE4A8E|nr:MarR family transcriptional regulator [Ancylomarina sp. 16SWW S1-10-2]MRT94421.1 MarR family transcriptional regulator [Ancylomarina sp. 16SWW S1-10-2]
METKDFSLLDKMNREIFRMLKKRFNGLNDEEITLSTDQYELLQAISLKEEDVIQKDMAEIMGKDKSAILRLIDSLEEKELIRRVVDNKDRRKNYLMITKIGYRVLKKYSKIIDKLIFDIQQGVSDSDKDTFLKVINHIRINVQKL